MTSSSGAGRAGFLPLVHAEWTKLRTVPGWSIALLAAVLVTVLLGVVVAAGSQTSCSQGPVQVACPTNPLGPDGEAVIDKFYFVHQPLSGNGAITARVTSLTGLITYPPPDHDRIVPGVVPWAKAGLMIKDGTRPGSAYAALMVTGGRGVRLQHNFTHDQAGRPGAVSASSPRWLRLTRSGNTMTAEESTDGVRWTEVGTASLAGLPRTVQIGLFVASPSDLSLGSDAVGSAVAQARLATATAVFDQVSAPSADAWVRDDIGAVAGDGPGFHHPGGVQQSDGRFTVQGNGDIAPLGTEGGNTVERTLVGTLGTAVLTVITAVSFITAEYRRGLIRTSQLASPKRRRVVLAKAVVVASVSFVGGLVGAAAALPLGIRILWAGGNQVLPASPVTQLRVIAGTAALLSLVSVLALALGTLFRRTAVSVTIAIALTILPYALAVGSVLPAAAAEWLLRVTPAAGFAIQQSIPAYPQVVGHYVASAGYFPLAPGAGLAVLGGWAAVGLGVAVVRLGRTDS